MKANPLFQDSTVSSGSNIRCQFEIQNVSFEDVESVVLKLTSSKKTQHYKMQSSESKANTYLCNQWVAHNQKIFCQFFVVTHKDEIHSSKVFETTGLYHLNLSWVDEELDTALDLKKELIFEAFESEEIQGKDEKIQNLIDKWGL